MALAIRCASCRAPLSVPRGVDSLACETCGAALALRSEGGAVFAVLDDVGGAAAAGGPWARVRRPPRRVSAAAAGGVALAAGLAWAGVSAAAGQPVWLGVGLVVAAIGGASALRAARLYSGAEGREGRRRSRWTSPSRSG